MCGNNDNDNNNTHNDNSANDITRTYAHCYEYVLYICSPLFYRMSGRQNITRRAQMATYRLCSSSPFPSSSWKKRPRLLALSAAQKSKNKRFENNTSTGDVSWPPGGATLGSEVIYLVRTSYLCTICMICVIRVNIYIYIVYTSNYIIYNTKYILNFSSNLLLFLHSPLGLTRVMGTGPKRKMLACVAY